jgi:hypothetical protein
MTSNFQPAPLNVPVFVVSYVETGIQVDAYASYVDVKPVVTRTFKRRVHADNFMRSFSAKAKKNA